MHTPRSKSSLFLLGPVVAAAAVAILLATLAPACSTHGTPETRRQDPIPEMRAVAPLRPSASTPGMAPPSPALGDRPAPPAPSARPADVSSSHEQTLDRHPPSDEAAASEPSRSKYLAAAVASLPPPQVVRPLFCYPSCVHFPLCVGFFCSVQSSCTTICW